jgi:hypothetical protein
MNNPLGQPGPDTQQSSRFLASSGVLGGILYWLAGLIQLTEEEQKNAGIYLVDQPNK